MGGREKIKLQNTTGMPLRGEGWLGGESLSLSSAECHPEIEGGEEGKEILLDVERRNMIYIGADSWESLAVSRAPSSSPVMKKELRKRTCLILPS